MGVLEDDRGRRRRRRWAAPLTRLRGHETGEHLILIRKLVVLFHLRAHAHIGRHALEPSRKRDTPSPGDDREQRAKWARAP